jgi:hypothetical protein
MNILKEFGNVLFSLRLKTLFPREIQKRTFLDYVTLQSTKIWERAQHQSAKKNCLMYSVCLSISFKEFFGAKNK